MLSVAYLSFVPSTSHNTAGTPKAMIATIWRHATLSAEDADAASRKMGLLTLNRWKENAMLGFIIVLIMLLEIDYDLI